MASLCRARKCLRQKRQVCQAHKGLAQATPCTILRDSVRALQGDPFAPFKNHCMHIFCLHLSCQYLYIRISSGRDIYSTACTPFFRAIFHQFSNTHPFCINWNDFMSNSLLVHRARILANILSALIRTRHLQTSASSCTAERFPFSLLLSLVFSYRQRLGEAGLGCLTKALCSSDLQTRQGTGARPSGREQFVPVPVRTRESLGPCVRAWRQPRCQSLFQPHI